LFDLWLGLRLRLGLGLNNLRLWHRRIYTRLRLWSFFGLFLFFVQPDLVHRFLPMLAVVTTSSWLNFYAG
jgi:hypothetical protein